MLFFEILENSDVRQSKCIAAAQRDAHMGPWFADFYSFERFLCPKQA
jgi:hypothetical protein